MWNAASHLDHGLVERIELALLEANSVHNLASLREDVERLSEAEALFRREMQVRKCTLGKEHADTLHSMHSLASILHATGKLPEAEVLFRSVFEARGRTLGIEHPDRLRSLRSLTSVLHVMGRSVEAKLLFRRAVEARERDLGDRHVNTLHAVHSYASLLQAMGRHSEAVPLFRRALQARECTLGKEHADTLCSAHSLASAMEARERGPGSESRTVWHSLSFESLPPATGALPEAEHSLNSFESLPLATGALPEAEPLDRHILEEVADAAPRSWLLDPRLDSARAGIEQVVHKLKQCEEWSSDAERWWQNLNHLHTARPAMATRLFQNGALRNAAAANLGALTNSWMRLSNELQVRLDNLQKVGGRVLDERLRQEPGGRCRSRSRSRATP